MNSGARVLRALPIVALWAGCTPTSSLTEPQIVVSDGPDTESCLSIDATQLEVYDDQRLPLQIVNDCGHEVAIGMLSLDDPNAAFDLLDLETDVLAAGAMAQSEVWLVATIPGVYEAQILLEGPQDGGEVVFRVQVYGEVTDEQDG